MQTGKIGIFDSGLGGLLVARGLIAALPEYDYCYLGDTARVPYGNRSPEAIYRFTQESVSFLFEQGCRLVILACNTASAGALRRLQQEFLPRHYPDRRILGVLIPAAEAAAASPGPIGVIATQATVDSGIYSTEIHKIAPEITVVEQAAPLLVPLIEHNALHIAPPLLKEYLAPLKTAQIKTLVLGCTHYPLLRREIADIMGPEVQLLAQDELTPPRLKHYLEKHQDFARQLGRSAAREYYVTELTPHLSAVAEWLFQQRLEFTEVQLLSSDA